MRLIKPSFEILHTDDYKKMIEIAGRTCYKSEDKINENSAEGFVEKMIKNNHYAMLEHGTIYLTIDKERKENYLDPESNKYKKYCYNKYTKVFIPTTYKGGDVCITTNLRVLVENGWLKDLKYSTEPTEKHEKRVSVQFICDRGVANEFVRHRAFSFAQESTRYCNYSKNKFGNELTFILPCWLDYNELADEFGNLEKLNYNENIDKFQSSEWNDASNFLQSIAWSESNYLTLLDNGWTPQQARSVLPNSLKTELIMTGFVSDWKHFFDLRALGTTGQPHTQAKELALPLYEEFKKLNLI
jgi:thymidylate synthase (FAD)